MGPAGIAMGAMSAYGGIKGRKKGRREAKRLERQRRMMIEQAQGFAGPENYLALLKQYRGAFEKGYMPQLRSMADAIGIGEQAEQQRWQSGIGKRGMSGSGIDFFGKRSIGGSKQAQLSRAKRGYDIDVERGARQQAGKTVSGQIQATLMGGVPFQERGSSSADLMSSLMGGMSLGTKIGSQSGYGGGGWQSWFKKPKAASPSTGGWGETWF